MSSNNLNLSDPTKLNQLQHERSLVLIKPDAVARHLVGEIITRFERKGIKIAAMKLIWPTDELALKHYEVTDEWLESSGQRTYNGYVEKGVEPPAEPKELARNTHRKLMSAITAGPVAALVLEGAHVIEVVRKMRGTTSPLAAEVGTIGFDYSLESYELADAGDWAIRNIIHGSDSHGSAAREIPLWFREEEVVNYETTITEMLYNKDWKAKTHEG